MFFLTSSAPVQGERRCINLIYEREKYYVSLDGDVLKGMSSVFCHILGATPMSHKEAAAAAAGKTSQTGIFVVCSTLMNGS